jgi:iron complex transport system substrate-binding protein
MGVSHASAEIISLSQADGGTLELPQPASRIITLAPHLAELAFAAGAGVLRKSNAWGTHSGWILKK